MSVLTLCLLSSRDSTFAKKNLLSLIIPYETVKCVFLNNLHEIQNGSVVSVQSLIFFSSCSWMNVITLGTGLVWPNVSSALREI